MIFTIRIQHAGDIKVLLSNIECSIEILQGIVFAEFVVVDEVRSVTMDECTERQTVLEGQVEVLNIDILVRSGLALAPQQQTFLRGHFLHGDVLDGESQNYRPDHTQSHF